MTPQVQHTDTPSPDPDPSHYCSAGMTWAWKLCTGHEPPWERCCDEHDIAYGEASEYGGLVAGIKARAVADRRLRECVKSTGHPIWAWTIYLAVRVGGWAWWWT